jgi:NAD dependent epimerase/dehydratase family enzyme
MLPVFRLGLGGELSSGRQWMSWVGMADVVGVVRHALGDARCAGPINVVAPASVTNAEFTAELGRALKRPAVLTVPAWALRALVGRGMADEALLASTRAVPQRLQESGYSFTHPTLAAAFRAVL